MTYLVEKGNLMGGELVVCGECGTRVLPTLDNKCPSCGKPIGASDTPEAGRQDECAEEPAAASESAVGTHPDSPKAEDTPQQVPMAEVRKGSASRHKTATVVCLLVVVGAAIGAVVFVATRPGDKWPPPLDHGSPVPWQERLSKDLPSKERTADIGAWSTIKDGEGRLLSSGPCLVEGEVVLSGNIFLVEQVPDLHLDTPNHFVVVDYGKDYTLIRLEKSKGHSLCMRLEIETHGLRAHSESTACFPGTRAVVGDRTYELRRDGWYLDDKLVHAVKQAASGGD